MAKDLENKTAIVTAASRGIGLAGTIPCQGNT